MGFIVFLVVVGLIIWAWLEREGTQEDTQKDALPEAEREKEIRPCSLGVSDPALNQAPPSSEKEMLFWMLRKLDRADMVDAIRDKKADALPNGDKDLLTQLRYKISSIKQRRKQSGGLGSSCPRCGGTGYIRRYGHVEGGRCFACSKS